MVKDQTDAWERGLVWNIFTLQLLHVETNIHSTLSQNRWRHFISKWSAGWLYTEFPTPSAFLLPHPLLSGSKFLVLIVLYGSHLYWGIHCVLCVNCCLTDCKRHLLKIWSQTWKCLYSRWKTKTDKKHIQHLCNSDTKESKSADWKAL